MMLRRSFLAFTAALLTACAPMRQSARSPGAGFAGPGIDDDAFVSFDGARLGLTTWKAQGGGEPWAVIVALHGMNDYAAGFTLAGEAWAKRGITTYAYDQRGFGRSPERGVWADDDVVAHDLRTMTALVRARHPKAILVVAGVSMGGGEAIAAFAGDNPPDADRLVLLSPAVWGWSTQYMPNVTALWISSKTVPGWVVEPPRFVTDHVRVTDNEDEMRRMSHDPLMLWGARSDALSGIVSLMQTAYRSTGGIKAPTLYLYGYNDDVIPKTPAFLAASRLKPTDKTGYYRDGYHLLLSDMQAWRVYADVEGFIRDPNAPLTSGVVPIPGR